MLSRFLVTFDSNCGRRRDLGLVIYITTINAKNKHIRKKLEDDSTGGGPGSLDKLKHSVSEQKFCVCRRI